MMNGTDDVDDDRGLIWRLPLIRSKELGKLGPAVGFGAGCGFGLGLGLLGGQSDSDPPLSSVPTFILLLKYPYIIQNCIPSGSSR